MSLSEEYEIYTGSTTGRLNPDEVDAELSLFAEATGRKTLEKEIDTF